MTKTKISDAEALEAFENLDPDEATMRDRTAVADIEQAVYARKVAEAATEEAVRRARQDGITWTEIASALGVSHQAAIKRYRDKVSGTASAPATKKEDPAGPSAFRKDDLFMLRTPLSDTLCELLGTDELLRRYKRRPGR